MRSYQKILFTLGLLTNVSNASAQNISSDRTWENFSGWKVFVSVEYQGCLASASYQDGTTVRLGYDGIVRDYFFNISNNKWRSYPLRKDFELNFELSRGRVVSGFFHTVLRDNLVTFEIGNVKESFLEEIAAASGIKIFEEDNQLASLSLIGSRRALNSMVECQQAVMSQ